MAQLGFHALIGIGLGKELFSRGSRNREGKKVLMYSFVLGNMLPDADFLLVILAQLFAGCFNGSLHRSITHSIFGILLTSLASYFLSKGSQTRRRLFAFGLALGMIAHIIIDIFLWFSEVKVLWPLGCFGIPESINLWEAVHLPEVVSNVLGALEFFAAGIYFLFLTSLAETTRHPASQNPESLLSVRLCTFLQWPLFLALLSQAFLPKTTYDLLNYGVFVILLIPMLVYVTQKFRREIEGLVLTRPLLPPIKR